MKYFAPAQPKTLSGYSYFLIYFASLIILFTSLLTTFFLWQRVEYQINTESEQAFHTKVTNIELSLKDKAQFQIDTLYDSILSSYTRGNFVSSGDWDNYVTSLRDDQKFSGIQSIAFVEKVNNSDKDKYIKTVSKEEKGNSLYKSFSFSPITNVPEHYVVKYVSPMSGNSAILGNDLSADDNVLQTLLQARDTGLPVRSSEQTPDSKNGSEFVVYMPLYEGKVSTIQSVNREQIRGFARVVYNSQNFFVNSLVDPNQRENIDIQIYDQLGNDKQKVFQSLTLPSSVAFSPRDLLTSDGIVSVAQKYFTISYAVRKDQMLGETERNLEVYVVVFGSMLSVLFSGIFYLLATSRARALILADEITRELNEDKVVLEQERAKLEIILLSIGDAVFVVNEKSQVILLNKVAQQYLDVSPSEAMNKHYCDIFHFVWERNPLVHCPKFVEDVIRTGVKKKLEDRYILLKKDDTKIPIDASASPVKDEDGKVIGCVVVLRDVTRERKIEDDKDNFLSVAAHQLKTPLGSMRWNLEMILGEDYGKIPAALFSPISQLLENNQRMIKLVSDFLDVSRINQHRVKDTPQPSDLAQSIKTVAEELKPMLRKKEMDIELKLEDFPSVTIDPARWKEVVEHLISNAIQYSFYQGKILVSLEKKADHIEFTVSDHGMGISKKDQLKIFSKFFRGENAVHSEADGSGLGLFVVKSYVEAWGGQVSFESKVGKGTTFMVSLPLEPKKYIADGVVPEG